MTFDLQIPLDRVTYRDGQLLDARDLRDDGRRDARLRRLHVKHLHGTWGIALGFTVAQVSAAGAQVPAKVTALVVGPGCAVDQWGRDLLLPESVQLSLPTSDGRFVFAVRYREDGEFGDAGRTGMPCLNGAFDAHQDRVAFQWRRPEEVRFGPEVPIVQVTIADGALGGPLDFRVRRYTQPFTRPHIDTRSTEEGRSDWRDWVEGPPDAPEVLGLELDVDTSQSGFIATPLYFAALQGDFSAGSDAPLFDPDLWPTGEVTLTPDSLGFIAAATRDSFTYRILNIARNPFSRTVTAAEAERRHWRVVWLGLEPVEGCEPKRDFSRVFSLSGLRVRGLSIFTRR
jgi:hypothetical protein